MDNKVDCILSHTCPTTVAKMYLASRGGLIDPDPTGRDLEHFLSYVKTEKGNMPDVYFGHWHSEWDNGPFRLLYRRILEILP